MASGKPDFDECMASFPPINPPEDLDEIMEQGLSELKKTPVNPKHRLLFKKSLGRDVIYEVSFTGYGGISLNGQLNLPRRKKGLPAIIHFHDYLSRPEPYLGELTDRGFAVLSMELRHHSMEDLRNDSEETSGSELDPSLKRKHPLEPYRQDSPEHSFAYATYMDAVRAIDFLRLQKEVDHNRIGLVGRGFGAGPAVFAAIARPESVVAVSLDRPAMVLVDRWLELSSSPLSSDMNTILEHQAPKIKTRVKKALDYTDPFHFSERIRSPLQMIVDMEDQSSPALCAFSLFHRVQSEKEMHVYMEFSQDSDHKKKQGVVRDFFEREIKRGK